MRSHRRFRPSVEFMSVRIAPSTSTGGIDPTADASTIPTTPIVDINDLSTAPVVGNATLTIIEPATSPTPTSTVC